MDKMDIDQWVDIPDSPDRVTTRKIFQNNCSDNENQRQSIPNHSKQQKFIDETSQNRPINIESGRKRLLFRLPRSSSSSSNSLHPKNIPVDLTDGIKHMPEARKRLGLENGPAFSHGPKKISIPVGHSSEGTDNTIRVGSSSIIGNGNRDGIKFLGNAQKDPGDNGFVPIVSNASPRINRQKRFVRNGCISPNNIAKAKEFSGNEINGSVAVVQNNASLGSSASPVSIDIMDLVSDENNSYKGKGKAVVCQPCSSKETDSRNKHWRGSSVSFNNPKETKDYNKGVGPSIEETGGWISTRNPSKKSNISLSDENQVIGVEMNEPKYVHPPNNTRTGRSGKGIGIQTNHDFTKNPKMPSSDHSGTGQTLGQPKSNPRLTTRVRRHKPESSLNHFEECSMSACDDPEIVLLSSPEPSTSRTASRRLNNLQPVIEVEESSPELRYNRDNENARVRQLEADERLARELQEQFYNETPAFGAGEFDQHIALALQHQDDGLAPPPHRPTRPNARGSRASNANREFQSHSSNAPRRGSDTRARAAALGRMTRLRSRFPGVGRTILPSAGNTSLFPPNMDVDMRMHILGALEAFSDMGVGPDLGLLQTQRDFNENDYEMLLALDENNDQRGGASARVINGLPQSTVQSTAYEETCVVCLETPTIGDTIRHLPCLHKFHKDCIDPWLRRKTSCPVCKSSVT